MDNDSTDSEKEIDEVQEAIGEDASEDAKSEIEGDEDIIGDETDDEKSEKDEGDGDGEGDGEGEAEDEEPEEPEEVVPANIPVEYEFVSNRTKNQIHKDVIVVDPKKRKTSNMISKTELVEVIGVRAAQIAQKATVFVDINVEKKSNGVTSKVVIDDPVIMAKMEVAQKKCPLVLRRIVKTKVDPKTGRVTEWVEDFAVREMLLPSSLKLV